MLSFGWFGSIVFVMGFGQAVVSCFQGTKQMRHLVSVKAALVGMLVQLPVMGIFPGASGYLVWTCIAVCFAEKANAVPTGEPVREPVWDGLEMRTAS